MWEKIYRVLEFRVTIGQLMALGIIVGTPYLLVGTVWSATHTAHLRQLQGVDLAVSFLGSILSWPVLIFANVCMT